MKKLNVLGLIAGGLLLVGFATSCSDTEAPNGTLKTDATSYLVGDSIKVTVSATDDKELSKVTVTFDGKEKTITAEEKSETLDGTVSFYAEKEGIDLVVSGEVTDAKDNKTKLADVKVTVKDASKAMAQVLGAQLADEGSYFSIKDMAVKTQTQVDAAGGLNIAFAFAGISPSTGAAVEPYLISPEEKVASWTGMTKTSKDKEKTYFKVSTLDFDKATASQLNKISATTEQKIKIEQGKVYEFVTANGDKGIVKVTTITAVANGTSDNYTKGKITVDVKVLKK
ncbi:MAG: hypothetical protein SNJ71_06715 [Bacteroidales bacterium]